jgi:hypothetical protein
VRRLVESLRKTEPDVARRTTLDQLLEQARSADRFRESAAGVAMLSVDTLEPGSRWRGVVAGTSAWAAAAAITGLAPVLASPFPGALAGVLVAIAPLAWFAGRTGGGTRALRGFLLGLAVIGPGICMPVLMLAGPAQYRSLGPGGNIVLGWSIAAGLAAALIAHHRDRRRRGSLSAVAPEAVGDAA